MASEVELLLQGSGLFPDVLRRGDLLAMDGQDSAEGQGTDVDAGAAESVSEADLPAFPESIAKCGALTPQPFHSHRSHASFALKGSVPAEGRMTP